MFLIWRIKFDVYALFSPFKGMGAGRVMWLTKENLLNMLAGAESADDYSKRAAS